MSCDCGIILNRMSQKLGINIRCVICLWCWGLWLSYQGSRDRAPVRNVPHVSPPVITFSHSWSHTHFIMISKLRRQYNLVQFSPICGGWWVSELTTQSDQAWPPPGTATAHPPARPGEPEFIINNYSNRWTENLPPANSQSLSAIPSVINNFHLQFLDSALHSVVWCWVWVHWSDLHEEFS